MAGRKPKTPTAAERKMVEALAGYGAPEFYIAKQVGVDPKTLRKHFRDELDHGMANANALVAESLFKKAVGNGTGAVTAAIFWAKTRLGWKETVVNEHSGPDGGPIRQEVVDLSKLSDTELAAYRLATAALERNRQGD